MPGEIIYNTADGTPWFMLAAWEYYRYSGDESFVAEMLPVAGYAVTAARASVNFATCCRKQENGTAAASTRTGIAMSTTTP